MSTYDLTYGDGSKETIVADEVIEDEAGFHFLRFVGGGQERRTSRPKSLGFTVERVSD